MEDGRIEDEGCRVENGMEMSTWRKAESSILFCTLYFVEGLAIKFNDILVRLLLKGLELFLGSSFDFIHFECERTLLPSRASTSPSSTILPSLINPTIKKILPRCCVTHDYPLRRKSA